MAVHCLQLKRVYDTGAATDGRRILVDRLWPRGLKKTDAKVDLWLKDIAPTSDLRQWFAHDPERFQAFSAAYQVQLEQHEDQRTAVNQALEEVRLGPVTLVYAAKDPVHNHAIVLHNFLVTRLRRE